LAHLFADNGCRVMIWSHNQQACASINRYHENRVFMPGIPLQKSITATESLEEALNFAHLLVVVIPSKFLRSVLDKISGRLRPNHVILSATKGIENTTLKIPGQIISEFLPADYPHQPAFLSGPNFALEVAKRHPTATVIASKDGRFARRVQRILSNTYFRCYTNDDIIGVQLGGAVKNIIAIASGILVGLGIGSNSQAALITRGLAEITRLGVKLGAQVITFFGISGLGDLVLTATGKLSRNRRVGELLGKGHTLANILSTMQMVAEGVRTTKSVYTLARKLDIEMPITNEVYNILYEHKPVKDAVESLMSRSLKDETGGYGDLYKQYLHLGED